VPAQVGHQGHGGAGTLPVDEEDTPEVHDEAYGPQEHQLPLGNLHTALGEDLHEACRGKGVEGGGGEKDRDKRDRQTQRETEEKQKETETKSQSQKRETRESQRQRNRRERDTETEETDNRHRGRQKRDTKRRNKRQTDTDRTVRDRTVPKQEGLATCFPLPLWLLASASSPP
jgi:hypothetical protein